MDISVVGGGLTGPLMAIYMAQRGHKVKLFERRSDLRLSEIHEGRSINMILSTRGLNALDQVGVDVSHLTIPMYGRMIHSIDGSQSFTAYGNNHEAIYSIHRSELNKVLLNHVAQYAIETHFKCSLQDYDIENNELAFLENDTITKYRCNLVIGADGCNSKVRECMGRVQDVQVTKFKESHGYKELILPAGPNQTFQMENNALHIWARDSFLLMAMPNQSGSFTLTLFLPHDGCDNSFAKLKSEEQIQSFFEKYFIDVTIMMPDYVTQFKNSPFGSQYTTKCTNWNYQDKCILIGDSAHSMVLFYGQGMNCGLEDCNQLNTMLNSKAPLDKILADYYALRKPNCDAVCDMSQDNFKEMRDRYNDQHFKQLKANEAAMMNKYPGFQSRYAMLSFTNLPYETIRRRGLIIDEQLNQQEIDQDRIYQNIMQLYDNI